jgi:hypothetical protein
MWPNGNQSPNQSAKDKEYIDSREKIILQTKLDRGKDEIKEKIENKWQCYYPWNLLLICHHKYFAKRDSNDQVEHSPYWTKEKTWWCPSGFDKGLVPGIGLIHI